MGATCVSCNEQLFPNAIFCHNCGEQQKCKSCETAIVKNAKHCIGCGTSLIKNNDASDKAVNTIKFNQTADSRSYEVAFTDNVAAGVVDVIKNMADNQSQFKISGGNRAASTNNFEKSTNRLDNVTSTEINEEEDDEPIKADSEIPHITDVENTLDCSELHWILIYAYYVSDHGKNVFSKDNLLKAYKEKRETVSRVANFSNKWKGLFNGLVKTVRTNEFKLTDKGVETVVDLIQGKIKSKASKTLHNKKSTDKKVEKSKDSIKKGARTPAKSIQTEEFDLYKNAKKISLSDFMTERKIGDNTANRILAIAYYITNVCKLNGFSEGNIEYAYKVLGLNKRPLHLYQTILNTKMKKLWFDQNESSGTWKLARAGEVHFEENFSGK